LGGGIGIFPKTATRDEFYSIIFVFGDNSIKNAKLYRAMTDVRDALDPLA
jgi:hypothetical protein